LCYCAWLVATVSTIDLTLLDTRYWSPVYVPLLLLALLALDTLHLSSAHPERPDAAPSPAPAGEVEPQGSLPGGSGRPRPRYVAALALVVGCALLTVKPVADTYTHLRYLTQRGLGYASEVTRWRDAEIVRYLKAHPPDGPVYTNCLAS